MDEEVSLEDYELEEINEEYPEIESSADEDVPDMSSEEWSDYAIRKFRDDELFEGNPTVDGLRRVVELLLGTVIYSVSKVYGCPSAQNGFHATVGHTIKIALKEDKKEVRIFGDVADVHPGNTQPEYANYSVATAATRAEGRALRKALKLRRVVAAEELAPIEEETKEGKIRKGQIWTLDMLASRIDVNLWAFVNAGAQKYENIEDVDYDVAYKMIQKLSDWQNDRSKIKLELKGYDKNWRPKQ